VANPAKKLESLLRLHRFELVSQRKHLKYKNPQGKIYVIGKTPSDIRAGHKALTVLKRVIANPVPTSEVIEEERQRRDIEATITLQAQPKPSIAGVAGIGRGRKSKGTGIYYEEEIVPTAEELALKEELRQRANGNRERKEAEKRERRALLRADRQWARRLRKFRRAMRQVDADTNEIASFLRVAILLALARHHAAQEMKKNKELVFDAEQRERLVIGMFQFNDTRAYGEECDEQLCAAIEKVVEQRTGVVAGFLVRGRIPRFYLPLASGRFLLTRKQVSELRRAVVFMERVTQLGGEIHIGRELGTLRLDPIPEWLRDGVMRLGAGENKIDGEAWFEELTLSPR
jgi:hypothetical protein